ncbi:MAG: hypothetical protein COW84_11895 [Gammaproteobacteria bacterium CG22_combo_CG10-13_8_21_14_all_40_8]|nr:MAG: hypothetical protein COW84_11895 [Gammaproteobacteria bacterium CG22_combo_CG10-13_8_21_14_all_40_8]
MAQPNITFLNQTKTQGEKDFDYLLDLVAHEYTKNKRLLIFCETDAQMLTLDEALWQLAPERFLAHATIKEPTHTKAPIVLTVNEIPLQQGFSCCINLQPLALIPWPNIPQIYEFVPMEAISKQKARDKFKAYSLAGIRPQFKN